MGITQTIYTVDAPATLHAISSTRPGKTNQQVAPVHARVQLYPRSGVPMLFGVDPGKPVVHRSPNSPHPLPLTEGQGHVLYQMSNSFSVGLLHYVLEFAAFSAGQYERFVKHRNSLLEAHALPSPHTALSALWRQQDIKRGLIITHGTVSVGKFGVVSAGVMA